MQEKPNGPVAGMLLGTGIGAFALGLLTTLAEASESWHTRLEYNERVGPLSGKSILAVLVFVIASAGIGYGLRKKNIAWKPVVIATVVLIVLGLIGTFPTFFLSFAPEE